MRSIGIELANAGWLEPTEGGDILKSWWGKEFEIGDPNITAFAGKWREHYYYEAYTQEQIDATCELVVMLCDRFGIPKKLPAKAKVVGGKASLKTWFKYKGVLHHAMLRKDKSDLTPQFGFRQLSLALGLTKWGPDQI